MGSRPRVSSHAVVIPSLLWLAGPLTGLGLAALARIRLKITAQSAQQLLTADAIALRGRYKQAEIHLQNGELQ